MNLEFKFNDGGRSAAGYKGTAGDCAVRAAAIGTGILYEEVYWDLFERARTWEGNRRVDRQIREDPTPRNGVYREVLESFLFDHGWIWEGFMKIGSGCTCNMNAESLERFDAMHGPVICRLSRHYSTIIDGVINDTYDPSRDGNRCVYGWWRPTVDATFAS